MNETPRKTILAVLTFMFSIMSTSCSATDMEDGLYAEFNTTKGVILVRLFPEQAPLTVMNFVGLAEGSLDFANKSGPFYDGITFHRVIADFMIQGGDPEGTGRGGPGYQFPDETDNGLIFDRPGILAMANSGPDTNGSQFFITHVPTPWLDGKHTIFGEVLEGQDIVDTVAQGDSIEELKIIRTGVAAQKYQAAADQFKELESGILEQRTAAAQEQNQQIMNTISERWPDAVRNPENGIYSVVKTEGTGSNPPSGTQITVHYTGTLMDGTKFDSSRDRNQPFEFSVGQGQVIPGWDISLMDMKKGERRIIILPPDMAYGSRGFGPIPPDSWLVFDVELIDF